MAKKVFIQFALILCWAAAAAAQTQSIGTWYLPQALSDKTVSLTFEVDTTWHKVHGSVSGIHGKAWLSAPADSQSVSAQFDIPAHLLKTGNSSRDERLYEILSTNDFPNIVFTAQKLTRGCTPAQVRTNGICKDSLNGELQIRAVKKQVSVPVSISREGEAFLVHGTLAINWPEYDIEDPSIFVARVDPIVNIDFTVKLAAGTPN